MDNSRQNLRDSHQSKQKKANYNYGNLKYWYFYEKNRFGKTESDRKKITLKTFFGNPEIEIFCVKFDPED